MKDFFVSYNRADRAWAEWIAWQIEASGASVTLQAWDFRPGGNFVLDMQRALTESRQTLAVLSPDFLASAYTAPEWAAAFAGDPQGVAHRLVPVRVRECQPQGLLATIVYIDLVGAADRDDARQRLRDGLKQRLKPDHEPALPPLQPLQSASVPAAEPPWPPALEIAADVAGSVFWRVVRMAAVALATALLALLLLRAGLPLATSERPAPAAFAALLLGVVVSLVLEALLRLRRRPGARR